MMLSLRIGAALLALSCWMPASNAIAGEEELARDLAATCAGCHGTDGKTMGAIPRIAGMKQSTMLTILNEYKNGLRQATVMQQIAKGYSQKQLELITSYFSKQK